MKKTSVELYEMRKDVKCVKCGNRGAVISYGKWFSNGLGEEVGNSKSLEKYRDKEFMDHTMGFGGTVPHECLNCESTGLIDFNGLEGYKKAFETIE